jgi:hypothetical protein
MKLIDHVKIVWIAMRMDAEPEWLDLVVLYRLVALLPHEDLTALIVLAALHIHELDWLNVGHMTAVLQQHLARYYTTSALQNKLVRISYEHSQVLLGINDTEELNVYNAELIALCRQILSANQTLPTGPHSLASVLERAFAALNSHASSHPEQSALELNGLVQRQLSFQESTLPAQTGRAPDSATPASQPSETHCRPPPSRGDGHTAQPGTHVAAPAQSQCAPLRRSSRVRSAVKTAGRPLAARAAGPQRSLRCKRSLDSDIDVYVGRKRPATAMEAGR